MPNESAYVQVATDGSGKKIANVSVTEPQAVDTSGNAQADLTRYQQEVTLTDARGDFLDRTDEILEALKTINETLLLVLGQFDSHSD